MNGSGRGLRRRPGDGVTAGAVLVLHGGRVSSLDPVAGWQLAVVRAELLAAAVHRRLRAHGVEVWSLRFAVRGWNGGGAGPVADTRWALTELRRELGDLPVVLAGHSMGARTALRVAGDPGVTGVVALAPWLPAGEPVGQLGGRRVVLAHGTLDRVTDPEATWRYAERARRVTADVACTPVTGDGHAMLRRARDWHDLAATAALRVLEARAGSVR